MFTPEKAAFAVERHWAKYADPQDNPKTQKHIPPIAGKTAPAQAWEAVMALSGGDLAVLKAMAKERKIKGWALAKDAEGLAKKIAEAGL